MPFTRDVDRAVEHLGRADGCGGSVVAASWVRGLAGDSPTVRGLARPGIVVPECDDAVMSLTAALGTAVPPDQRLEVLFEELAELAGQRNAIDGRIVEIVAELDRDELCGSTGHARWRGWWPGSWARPRPMPTRFPRSRAVRGVSPLRARHAGGSTVAGSGRRHRRTRRCGL